MLKRRGDLCNDDPHDRHDDQDRYKDCCHELPCPCLWQAHHVTRSKPPAVIQGDGSQKHQITAGLAGVAHYFMARRNFCCSKDETIPDGYTEFVLEKDCDVIRGQQLITHLWSRIGNRKLHAPF
ncbi:hypothetical protein D3C87_1617210 [compost metagenome]